MTTAFQVGDHALMRHPQLPEAPGRRVQITERKEAPGESQSGVLYRCEPDEAGWRDAAWFHEVGDTYL